MNVKQADPLAYSVQDACRVTSIGKTKIYALMKSGRLESRRVDGRRIIPAASLRALIEGEAA